MKGFPIIALTIALVAVSTLAVISLVAAWSKDGAIVAIIGGQFLAIMFLIYRTSIEYQDNAELQKQKGQLLRRVFRYRQFIRGRNPVVTDMEIKAIEKGESIQ